MNPARVALHWLLGSLPILAVLAWLADHWPEAPFGADAFRQLRPEQPTLDAVMTTLSDWGNIVFYPVYAGILIVGRLRRDRRMTVLPLAYLVAQVLVSFLLVRLLKIAIGEPRPDVFGPLDPLTLDPGHHSMPSGHTTEITGAALPLAFFVDRWWFSLLMGGVIAAMGFSRIYLGEHFPHNVLAGWMLGCWAALVVAAVVRAKTREPA
jgi:undecaprenyl-diphosphatase